MKKFAFILVMCILMLSFVGCEKEDDNTLNVYNWGDYIGEDTLKKFTEETGIKVNYDVFDSNEAMYTKFKSGGVSYDVLFPSDYMIEKLIKEDMLMPLNFDNLDSYEKIDDKFKNLAYDPENIYSVPYMWGTLGILYNPAMVDDVVDSWEILWHEKYKNKIVMKNSVRDSFVPALKLLNRSINSTNQADWEDALKLLQDQKSLVQGYSADEVRDKMIGEEAAMALMYSGEALLTMEDHEELVYVVPKEGSNLWFDAMVISKNTEKQEAAEAFINFMTRPDIAYENAEYIGYSTPVPEAKAMLPIETQEDPAAYPDSRILELCEVFVDLGSEMTNFMNDKWNELLAY